MVQGPLALGIQHGVQVGAVRGQQFLGLKAVKAHQPIGLIQPVLPQQGRLGVQGGQLGVLHHRHVGREEHPLELIAPVKRLGQEQYVPVALRGGPNDHLGALPRRGEAGGVAVQRQLVPAAQNAPLNLPHGPQDGQAALVRSQGGQAALRGQFDVHAEPVGQHPHLGDKRRVRPRNGLGVDVAPKGVLPAQQAQGLQHQLAGAVRRAPHRAGQKQPLDVVAPVKAHG